MTYQEIIQQVGKQIKPKVYYYLENTKIEVPRDSFEMAKPKFNAKLLGTVMKGLELELKTVLPDVAIYLDVVAKFGDNSATKTYGPYYFKELPTYNADTKTYTHILYDEFVKTMVDYQAIDIKYPCTIYDYFIKLVETLGLTTNVSSLVNGHLLMPKDIYSEIGYTYRDVLEDIAQANGVLFEIDGQVIKIAVLGAEENKAIVDDDILKNTNIAFGEHFGPINTIVLSRSAESDNIYKEDVVSVAIHGRKELKISNNQLMNDNNRSDFLPNLLEKLKGIEYDIFDTELVGYGGFLPLQKVEFQTGDNSYYSYIFNNEIEITQGYKEVVYTDLPEETTTDYKASDTTDKRIKQAYRIVDKQNLKIEDVVKQTDEQSQKIAQVTQTVNEIKSEISEVADITISADGYGNVSLANINKSEPIYLKIYPTNGQDISYLYPRDNLYPSDDLFPKGRTLRFSTADYSVDYELPNDLLYYDEENYDEFILDYDAQSCVVNKKVGYNADGSKYILESPQTIEYEYPIIDLEVGDYTIEMLNYSNAFLFARLMVQNIYTDQFATKMEMNSAITQTANSIKTEVSEKYATQNQVNSSINQMASSITSNVSKTYATKGELTNAQTTIKQTTDNISSEVSKKVGDNEIISKINQSLEEITILAKKLGLTANDVLNIIAGNEINLTSKNIAIKSNNFSVDKNGKLNCSDATITGGKLKISDSTGNAIITLIDLLNNTTTTMRGSEIKIASDSNYYSTYGDSGVIIKDGSYTNSSSADSTILKYGSSYTMIDALDGLSHSSKAEYKKNINKLENNLNLIKNCDVYSYLFKEENEDSRLHLGLVIGEGYNTPKEVLNKEENGIDFFNMCAIMWGSIKEQQEIIENLKKEIKILKGE